MIIILIKIRDAMLMFNFRKWNPGKADNRLEDHVRSGIRKNVDSLNGWLVRKSGQPVVGRAIRSRRDREPALMPLLMGCLMAPVLAAAADNPEAPRATTLAMDRIVVTGTRSERLQAETPVRTEVVSSEEIRRTHATSLTEALRYMPGLLLRDIHGKAGQEVWLQGINADRVLVVYDGLPVTATTGSSVDVSQLSLIDVDRVEVVKGATSAQYGSAAMGGVINIVPRGIPTGFSGEAVLLGGTYGDQNGDGQKDDLGRYQGRLQLGLGSQQLRARIALEQNGHDGIDPDPSTWIRPGDSTKRRHLDGRLEWHPGEQGRFYVQASQLDDESESRYDVEMPGFRVDQAKFETLDRLRMTSGALWRFSPDLEWRLDLVHEAIEDETYKQGGRTRFDFRDAELGTSHATTQFSWSGLERHQVQLGLDYHRDTLEQTKDGIHELRLAEEAERTSHEIYLQDDWFFGERWELLSGVRVQDDSDFGIHVAPKINLRYELDWGRDWSSSARLSWGQGYRVPNLKERHYLFDHSALGYIVVGNPDLEPERSDSWQLGLGAVWRQQFWFDLNLFYNRLKDLVVTDEDTAASAAQGLIVYRYLNLDRARTQGVELVLGWQPAEPLRLDLGYSWMRTENEETGRELTQRPRHQVSASADWRVLQTEGGLKLGLNLRGRYQSDELVSTENNAYSPAWFQLDAKVNLDLNDQFRLFAGVDNLFDEQRDFVDPYDYGPVAGRYLYLGARYAWGGLSN